MDQLPRCGETLGQYQCAGELNSAPYYFRTDDGGLLRYLYRDAQTAWRVALDGFCIFHHPPTEDTPPLTGWQCRVPCNDQFQDDPTMEIQLGPLSPPEAITLQAKGELAVLRHQYFGTFVKTDLWLSGRPVFRNKEKKLLIYWDGDWCVEDNLILAGIGDGVWYHSRSGQSGLWPEPARLWQFWDGEDYKEEVITVTTLFCPAELSALCVTKLANQAELCRVQRRNTREQMLGQVEQLHIPESLKPRVLEALQPVEGEGYDEETEDEEEDEHEMGGADYDDDISDTDYEN